MSRDRDIEKIIEELWAADACEDNALRLEELYAEREKMDNAIRAWGVVPKIKVVVNKFIPLPGFSAMMLFGRIWTRKTMPLNDVTLNHEAIHAAQEMELWYVGFWLWYGIEWLLKSIYYMDGYKAYKAVRFEKEAYTHEKDMGYLVRRRRFEAMNN